MEENIVPSAPHFDYLQESEDITALQFMMEAHGADKPQVSPTLLLSYSCSCSPWPPPYSCFCSCYYPCFCICYYFCFCFCTYSCFCSCYYPCSCFCSCSFCQSCIFFTPHLVLFFFFSVLSSHTPPSPYFLPSLHAFPPFLPSFIPDRAAALGQVWFARRHGIAGDEGHQWAKRENEGVQLRMMRTGLIYFVIGNVIIRHKWICMAKRLFDLVVIGNVQFSLLMPCLANAAHQNTFGRAKEPPGLCQRHLETAAAYSAR